MPRCHNFTASHVQRARALSARQAFRIYRRTVCPVANPSRTTVDADGWGLAFILVTEHAEHCGAHIEETNTGTLKSTNSELSILLSNAPSSKASGSLLHVCMYLDWTILPCCAMDDLTLQYRLILLRCLEYTPNLSSFFSNTQIVQFF